MSRFTGTGQLVRLILRRDRIRLPVWLLALIGLVGASAGGAQGFYDTPAARASYARTVESSAATVFLSGPPVGLDGIGGITVFEVNQILIGVALMAIFLTLRHTRADEEAGRTELLRAGVLGRDAGLLAVSLVLAAASVVLGAGTFAVFTATGLATGGSLLYGGSIAGVGLVFTAVALVAAQVTGHNRGAIGLSLAALGLAYVVRGVGDVTGSALVWASPLGWAQAVHAFADQRWWPLLLVLAFTVGGVALAGWLTTRRDLGAGLVAARPGPAGSGPFLGTPLGLAFRLQRGAIIAWSAGVAALGATFGALGEDVERMVAENPELAEVLARQSGGASFTDAFFGTVFTIVALVATGYTVSSALRPRTEESTFRAELVLATRVSRPRWLLCWLVVTLVGTVVVLGAGGLAAGAAFALVSGDGGQVGRLTLAALAAVPAALALGGVAAAVHGWLPRATALAWAGFAACFVVGWIGPLLRLPDWALEVSPYAHSPTLPDLADGLTAMLVVAVVALALAAAGVAGFRRRDLATE